MGREYYDAMDKVYATEDWKTRTLAAMESAPTSAVRRGRPAGRVLIAAAVCGALLATALALSPGLRGAVADALGGFLPYARNVEGVSAIEQGIEVRAVSALSDGNTVRCYLSARDLTGDRLGSRSTFGSIDVRRPNAEYVSGGYGNGRPVSYDPETRTVLYELDFHGDGPPAQGGTLEVVLGGFEPGVHREEGRFSQSLLTPVVRESRELPSGGTVLTPEQTPSALEGTAAAALSSIGFDAEGRLHIQFRLQEGLNRARSEVQVRIKSRSTTPEQHDRLDRYLWGSVETAFEVDGQWYVDWSYQVGPSDLEDLILEKVTVKAVSGERVQGEWVLSIPLEDVPHRRIALEEQVGSVTVRTLDLTALGLSTESDPKGGAGTLDYPATVFLSNGAALSLGGVDSQYHNNGYTASHWSMEEPMDPEQVVGVAFGYWYIPIDGDKAGPGCWLDSLPGAADGG